MIEEEKTAAPVGSPSESDPVVLLKKIQQHLVFLEKKIDALIGQSQGAPQGQKPVFKRNSFSRPPRPFTHPHGSGPGRGKHQQRSDSGGASQNRPFEGARSGNDNRGFFRKKKPFFRSGRG